MWAVNPTTLQQPSLSSSTPSRKSMPALLVFLPSLVKALRRGEQTSGLLVRPWPAVCDAGWEFFSPPSFLGWGVCSGLTGQTERPAT